MNRVIVVDSAPAARQPLSDRAVARLFAACIVGSMVAWLSILIGAMIWLFSAA